MADKYARYARQTIFRGIGEAGQEKLLNARVALVGCGADGTLIADRLVRAGVGHLVIVDRDFVELDNLQRQFLYDEEDSRASLPKAVAAERHLSRINSQVVVKGVIAHLNAANAEELLSNTDLVMDGTDNPQTRYMINDVCVKQHIPWVYCGVAASYGVVMTVVPYQTACLRCVYPDPPPPGSYATGETAGLINPIIPAIAGIAVAEGLKLLVGNGERLEGMFRLDLWENTIETSDSIPRRPDCPCCGRGEYAFLEPETGDLVVSPYGSDAMQIRPSVARQLSVSAELERLRPLAQVIASNDHLIRFEADGYEIVLFVDGRVVVKRARDETLARSLYARYIGAQ